MKTSKRGGSEAGCLAVAGDLPDINVWLALAMKAHPHNEPAMDYWQHRASARVCFCRITMLGLVRLLTQPKVMGAGAMTLQVALQAFDKWLALAGVHWADEPSGCSSALNQLVDEGLPPRMITDAYLASFAQAGGLRLVSFDADFQRFEGLQWLQLRPAAEARE